MTGVGTAVITGAGSGIGAALCRVLADRSVRVIAADLDEASALATAASIDRAIAMRCDVTNADDVERLAEVAWREGGVDLWINNAGIAIGGATDALSLADWRRVLDVNLAGVVHGVHAIYPRMIARRNGHIVNIASVAGLAPYPFALPYTTSKHAVVGLSQALRAEARGHGVRVSVACPGRIETPIWQRSEVRGELGKMRKRFAAKARPRIVDRITGAMPVDECAEAILRGIEANRGIITVTREARFAWLLDRVSPELAVRTSAGLARIVRRFAR